MTAVQVPTNPVSSLDESGLLGERYTVVRAENATLVLRDALDRETRCTDLMSAYAAVNFGHRNRAIDAALLDGSDIAALFYPPDAAFVAARLCAAVSANGSSRRVLYQVGGSFAVSTAIALARRLRPGRVLAVDGAFHGLGVDALAVTTVQRGFALQDTGFTARLTDQVSHLRPGELPQDWSDISCVLYEPVQGANGYVPLDPAWLRELETSARAAGVTVVADEIQCGFYRHGHLSVARAWGLDPDVVLFGKSLTNGMYPLSAVVYKTFLERGAPDPVHLAHTFQTGALGFAAAAGVLRYLEREPVALWSERVATGLRTAADGWLADGLIAEAHVTGPALSFEPVRMTSQDLVRSAFRQGVLPFSGGSHGQRVRIAPPLTIPARQLASAISVIDTVLRQP